MSGSAGRLANPLGPGVPVPGGGSADMPPPPPSGGSPMGAGAGGALGAGSPMGPPGGPSGGGMGMMPSSLEGAKKLLKTQTPVIYRADNLLSALVLKGSLRAFISRSLLFNQEISFDITSKSYIRSDPALETE